MLKFIFAFLALTAVGSATCQTAPAPRAPSASGAPAPVAAHALPVSAAKLALVQRVLTKMPMEGVGMAMLQTPVAEALRQARSLLQGRVSEEKQEATMKEINADAAKFWAEAGPVVRASTQQQVDASIAPLLAQRFSEDELRALIVLLESPVKAKFEALLPEIQKTLGEGVSKATGPQINPKLSELQQHIGLRMRAAIAP